MKWMSLPLGSIKIVSSMRLLCKLDWYVNDLHRESRNDLELLRVSG